MPGNRERSRILQTGAVTLSLVAVLWYLAELPERSRRAQEIIACAHWHSARVPPNYEHCRLFAIALSERRSSVGVPDGAAESSAARAGSREG